MKKWLNQFRLQLFLLGRTMGYTQDYIERIYHIYLNHHKVIHYRDGFPVYSLSTPAVFSKPAANMFARQVFRGIQNKNLPNLMSFAINDECNAVCKHCSFFAGVADGRRTEMPLEDCQRVITEAQELGVSVINFVGGEPLLRPDFPQIIASVDKELSTTVAFTNGWSLAERAQELRQAGLDSVYISLDAANAAKHDVFRRKRGLFDRAIQGIQVAKKLGFSTGISCCITPESFVDGELDRIIELGKQIGVHEIMVFDALPTGRYKHRKDLMDRNDWVDKMIDSVKPYNEDETYPGVILFAYMTSHRSVGCSCGTSYFYVSPYGDIMSCDFNHRSFGNVLDQPLFQIWDTLSTSPGFSCAKWGGCKIKTTKYHSKKWVATSSNCH